MEGRAFGLYKRRVYQQLRLLQIWGLQACSRPIVHDKIPAMKPAGRNRRLELAAYLC